MHRVTIESLAFGGHGIARINGKACFIPYGLPGDELLIEMTSNVRGVNWAKILEIYEPSSHRYDPICPLFEECGGCHWLHFDYAQQVKWKTLLVKSALKRIARLDNPETEIVCDDIREYGYRTRARFHFTYENDLLSFGFYAPKSNTVVDLRICPLLHCGINDLLPYIKHVLNNVKPLEYSAGMEIIQNPLNKESLIWLDLSPEEKERSGELAQLLMEIDDISAVDWSENPSDKIALDIAIDDIKAWVPAGSFSQSSFLNNNVLTKTVLDVAGDLRNKRVFDLYCGWGNLSLPCASKGAAVIGFDNDPIAIEAANLSASDNRLESANYEELKDNEHASRLDKCDDIDILILDPPRVGAKSAVESIARSSADKIIYVSCDPNTFARDLKIMHESGRSLARTYVLDMIPQTYHIETVNLIV